MANQVIVTNTGNVQVALTPPANVQVQISRAAIGTVSNVPTANFANYAGNVTGANQPNITGLGTLSNLSVTGTVTSGNVSTPAVYSQGMVVQGYDFVQMQYSNGVALPVTPYDIGTGSWFYLDPGGAVWQSNTTGTLQTVTMDNNGNVSATGNITAPYFIGNGSQLTGIVANSVANANYSNFAGEAFDVNVANVTGLGNIATVNLDGNVANLLTGNGTFVAIPTGGGNTDNISNGTSNVSIPLVDGNVQVYANNQHWTFTDVGNLLLAGGNGVIQSIANSSLDPINPNVSTMVLTPDQGNSSQALVLDPTTPGHIHLRAPGSNIDQPQANVYLGGELSSFEVGVFNGAVPNLFIHSNNQTWRFDIDGNLTLPGNTFAVNYANGTQVPLDGPVANANYANFAGTAYSVDGANVSGEVANANYSSYANVAASANSVALANVVGIGNIANINLDGSSSNVLFGNGVFAPESTSIANANYANFAGNLINGTSNLSIPVANGAMYFSPNGLANLVTFNATGGIGLQPTSASINGLVINTYGNSAVNDVQRISSFRYRGSNTAPLSVQGNDNLMRLLAAGSNGTALQTNSTASIRAVVDASYTANGANIPVGWNMSVNDTNSGTNNQQRIHNFYSNGNVTFNNAIFGNSLSVTGNVTGSYILGNGSSLSSLTGANVTGAVANATYAANAGYADNAGTAAVANSVAGANVSGQVANALVAGTVYTNAQPNITSTGNLVSVNINNGNVVLPTTQFQPNGIAVGSTANANLLANSLIVVSDYGNGQGDGNLALTKAISYVKARGNSTTPTAVSQGDFIQRDNFYANNGTSNVLHASIRVAVANTNSNANAIWGGGNVQITTGNPLGDVGNANALSAYNTFAFNQNSALAITQGTAPTGGVNGMISLVHFGGSAGPNVASGAGISFNRFYGNRDNYLAVGPGAQTGRIIFLAGNANGSTGTFNARVAQFGANVDNSYVQGTANVPQGMFMQVCDNTTQYTHNFYANSAVSLAGNLSANGGYTQLSNSRGGATTLYFQGDKTPNSSFGLDDAQFSVTMSNVDTTGGFSPFRFQQYAPTSNQFGPMYMYRDRGTSYFSQAPVVANDKIMDIRFIVNSNNTTTSVGAFQSTVTYNDNAGNVGTKLDFDAVGQGTTGYLNGRINLSANITDANNFQANNVTINNSGNNFMKLSYYSAAALTAITGSVGWMAAVTDSGGGGNPNGMIAFWDTTHTRWSYIHDNSAV